VSEELHRTHDSATIVTGLASPSLAERDAATRAACSTGAPIARQIARPIEGESATAAARRVWTFFGIHLLRAAYKLRDERLVEHDHRGALADALAALCDEHGLAPPVVPDRREVSLSLSKVTFLEAVDLACRQAGARVRQRGAGRLVVEPEAEPPYPATYAGACRIRVVEVAATRSCDFVETRARVQLRLRLDWEWPFDPIGPPALELAEPAGARIDAPVPGSHGASEIVVGLPEHRGATVDLRGTVSALFRARREDLRIPAGGATVEAHGLTAQVKAHDADGAVLTLAATDPRLVAGVSSVVLCIDVTGAECIAKVQQVRTLAGPSQLERWNLAFAEGFGPLAEVRVRVTAKLSPHALPFALSGVPVP
jgi:hypothetical protein